MDLEMTGLDPATDTILEIATLVTDDDLEVIAEGPDLVVHQPPERLTRIDDVVRRMHTTSGLLAAVAASALTLEAAGTATLAFIQQHAPERGKVPLAGNSIGTDRRFLATWLPDIEQWLHYRSIDVSTIKELTMRWYPEAAAGAPVKGGNHRALDDNRQSLAELRYNRRTVFR
jgi:oligoribonuclease